MMAMTPWVQRLLIANVVMFLIAQPGTAIYQYLWLYVPWLVRQPWSVVTYMFLHAGLGHIFFNMIGLFFFGPRLEDRLGARNFLLLYFLSGLGGAVFTVLFASQYPVVGASGAVYGVLLSFALFWPQERIYIWGVLPVPAWLLATLMVFGSLYSGITGSQSGTAHFAHLGGLAFGFAFIKWWEHQKGAGARKFQKSMRPSGASGIGAIARARWKGIDVTGLHEINRDEVVRLLAKVEKDGVASLTESEREFLDRMAAR